MLDVTVLGRELLQALEPERARLGLRGELRADYVENPGNFQTANFTVGDGRVKRHVKLSREHEELDRWFALRELLRERYRAPEVLGRVEVGAFHGLVFPYLEGRAPTDELLPEILRVVGRLHVDRDLASWLQAGPTPTLRSCYLTGIFRCLSEDLDAVKGTPEVRGLLSAEDLRFAEDEVERLRRLGEERIPEEPATAAIHGDLWQENLLASGAHWWLLDWDSLRIGDPAWDYAALLYEPMGRGVDPSRLLPPDRDLRSRFDLYLRARCFDEIVDPLSDLTVIPAGLADRETTWRERAQRSALALARYRDTFPGCSGS